MKSTKLECKDCKEYKNCKEKDGNGFCPLRVWINLANQLLGTT